MAKDNQQKSSNQEANFFEQNDYQNNVGLITFGLKNPVNKSLTNKDIENVNTLAPLAFIQHKFQNEKDYQLPSDHNVINKEQTSTEIAEDENLDYDIPEPDDDEVTIPQRVVNRENTTARSAETDESEELYEVTDDVLAEDNTLDDELNTFAETEENEEESDQINDITLDSDELVDDGNDSDDIDGQADEESALEGDELLAPTVSAKNENDVDDASEVELNSDEINSLNEDFVIDEAANLNDTKPKTTSDNITLSKDELSELTGEGDIDTDTTAENDLSDTPTEKGNLNRDSRDSAEPIKLKEDFFEEEPSPQEQIASTSAPATNSSSDAITLDEQALFNNFNQSLDSSVDEKNKKKLLEKALAGYKPENRDLILQSIQHRRISEEQIGALIDSVIENTNETLVVETLNQQLFKKTGYEIFERRDQERKQESATLNKIFATYHKRRFFAGLTIISTFLLFLVLSVYFSYENILAYRLYQKAIAAAQNEQYQDAELYFDEAYQLQPQVNHTSDLAEVYLKKNQLEFAKDKYNKLLLSFPNHAGVMVANSRFYRITKDFERAKALITLGERRFPQDLLVMNEKAEILLSEGFTLKDYAQAQKNWLSAEKIFSDLLVKDPAKQGIYLQRKLELAAIAKDFSKSRSYFNLLQGLNTPYELRSMTRYLAFLIETQEHAGDNFYQIKPELLSGIQNLFATSVIDQIIMQLEATHGKHYLINIEKARWTHRKNEFNQARKIIDESIDSIRKEQNFLLNDDLVYALNTAGMINIRKEEVIPALEYFQQSLVIAPNDHLANYYMGKINLTSLNQVLKSKEFFTRAFEQWFNPNDRRYVDVRYSLGYINFLEGKAETNPQNQEFYFKSSIEHWSELSRKKLPEKNYLIVFNLATSYLYLKEYGLAQIFFENNLEELKPVFDYYQERSDQVVRESSSKKNELQILSDVFNNLAVAQIKSQNETLTPGAEIPSLAIEHLINAITLKDQLGVLKGVPYVNFNTINDYPKYSASFTTKRPLVIGDSFIPNSMFEKIF